MANRDSSLVRHGQHDVQIVTVRFVGNTTSTGTVPTVNNTDLVSINRTGTGVHTMVFKHKFPALIGYSRAVVGTTAGLDARLTAIDVTAGTATITTEVGAVATDAATTDTVYLTLFVRNSGFNNR